MGGAAPENGTSKGESPRRWLDCDDGVMAQTRVALTNRFFADAGYDLNVPVPPPLAATAVGTYSIRTW